MSRLCIEAYSYFLDIIRYGFHGGHIFMLPINPYSSHAEVHSRGINQTHLVGLLRANSIGLCTAGTIIQNTLPSRQPAAGPRNKSQLPRGMN